MSAAAKYTKTEFAKFGNALSANFLATAAPVLQVGIWGVPFVKERAGWL
jgi:hypothetical protein